MNAFHKTLRYLKPYRAQMLLSFFLLMISSALLLAQPKITEFAIDRGLPSGNISTLLVYALIIAGAAVLSMLVNYGSGVLLIRAAQHMSFDLRNALYRKISSFSFHDFDRWRTGEIIVRMNSDVNTIRMFIRMGLFMMIQSIFMLVGSLISMYSIDTQLASIMSILLPSVLVLFIIAAAWIRPVFQRVREALDRLNNTLQENLVGAKLVRAFSRQNAEMDKFDRQNLGYYHISRNIAMIIGVLLPMLLFIGNAAVVLVMYLGGKQTSPELQGMSLGSLIAFSNYTLTAFFPVIMLGMVLSFLSMALASMDRVQQLLETEVSITDAVDAQQIREFSGRISFESVSFHYGSGSYVLKDFDLEILPGEMLGIIGTTGAGKSTLAHLIPRFYDTNSGSVILDGIDVKSISLSSLRRRVTVALQETTLFSGSIAENIAFGDPGADRQQIIEAARIACAHDFIMEKEDGYEHILGERGAGLSGGQRQRIAIARAILSRPDILILDDVTSSMDAGTERTVTARLQEKRPAKTIIIISQKINAIRHADRILLMDQGTITDEGTHEQLLKSSETYKEIYDTQNPEEYTG